MDFAQTYHMLTDQMLADTGFSDRMMHINVGLTLYLGAQLLLRTRRGSINALLIVIAIEAANEVMDRLFWGSWRWQDTIGDIVATVFWPMMVTSVSLYRRRRWSLGQLRQQALRASFAAADTPRKAVRNRPISSEQPLKVA
jgi:hypothetical protein